MELQEIKISSEKIYTGRVLSVERDIVELPNGKEASRDVIRHNGASAVVAISGDSEVLLVKQYRYPVEEILWEIPAGRRNSREESFYDCAVRELKEETGCTAEKMMRIGAIYPAAAYDDERVEIFLAMGLSQKEQKLDDDEFLTVEKVPFKKVLEMAAAGEIPDAKTQTGIFLAAVATGRLK
jgi:ADP-ribose pyrophosphatase